MDGARRLAVLTLPPARASRNLNNNQLSGTIPASLGQIATLQALYAPAACAPKGRQPTMLPHRTRGLLRLHDRFPTRVAVLPARAIQRCSLCRLRVH